MNSPVWVEGGMRLSGDILRTILQNPKKKRKKRRQSRHKTSGGYFV
jgi:hypothetical protein